MTSTTTETKPARIPELTGTAADMEMRAACHRYASQLRWSGLSPLPALHCPKCGSACRTERHHASGLCAAGCLDLYGA